MSESSSPSFGRKYPCRCEGLWWCCCCCCDPTWCCCCCCRVGDRGCCTIIIPFPWCCCPLFWGCCGTATGAGETIFPFPLATGATEPSPGELGLEVEGGDTDEEPGRSVPVEFRRGLGLDILAERPRGGLRRTKRTRRTWRTHPRSTGEPGEPGELGGRRSSITFSPSLFDFFFSLNNGGDT